MTDMNENGRLNIWIKCKVVLFDGCGESRRSLSQRPLILSVSMSCCLMMCLIGTLGLSQISERQCCCMLFYRVEDRSGLMTVSFFQDKGEVVQDLVAEYGSGVIGTYKSFGSADHVCGFSCTLAGHEYWEYEMMDELKSQFSHK